MSAQQVPLLCLVWSVVTYYLDARNGKTDALSRKDEYCEPARRTPFTILKASNFVYGTVENNLMPSIHSLLPTELFVTQICQTLGDASTQLAADLKLQDDILCYKDCIYVPEGQPWLQVLKLYHNNPFAGHFRYFKTWNLVSKTFWWTDLHTSVKQYITSCDLCTRIRSCSFFSRPWPLYLTPCTTPVDLIVDLPCSQGHTMILVVVDLFTKMAHFVRALPSLPLQRLPIFSWRIVSVPQTANWHCVRPRLSSSPVSDRSF